MLSLSQALLKRWPLFKPRSVLDEAFIPWLHHKECLQPLAKPEKANQILKALSRSEILGRTHDDQVIYLSHARDKSALLREIGRLREMTFRRVGEGTGRRRDLDIYDHYYHHLVLWNHDDQQIGGAYRIGDCQAILQKNGLAGLYTHSLFDYQPEACEYLNEALELGRSFVHPDYWGKASLDYLWQGIGSYLRHRPNIRYLIGPVSISADLPVSLIDELVWFYQHFYCASESFAIPKQPYRLNQETQAKLLTVYADLDRKEAFDGLQARFKSQGYKVPVLFKQYTALFKRSGIQFLGFNVDPNFSDCIDGLMMVDIQAMKAKKRARYLEDN